ncbi:MAG: alpha/beta fold hydrolase, partial [Caulobacteraceae bacterium]
MAFESFQLSRIDTGEATLRVRHGGAGPPLLLLHGYPETHMMWGKIADDLARDFTVVAPDLRGYAESSKPVTTEDHEPYSKRAMARDVAALM